MRERMALYLSIEKQVGNLMATMYCAPCILYAREYEERIKELKKAIKDKLIS